MIAIRLEETLVQAIDAVSDIKHTSRSDIVRQAIIRFLEDQEDLALAEQAQAKMKSSQSLSSLRKELGLDR